MYNKNRIKKSYKIIGNQLSNLLPDSASDLPKKSVSLFSDVSEYVKNIK